MQSYVTMNRIFFTADLHFGHDKIGKHMPDRPYAGDSTSLRHDKWLEKLWQGTVDDEDTVYIVGDLTLMRKEQAQELLERLPGRKILICGNHDSTVSGLSCAFADIRQIHEINITPSKCPVLKFPIRIIMCPSPCRAHGLWRSTRQ